MSADEPAPEEARHRERMQRRKAVVDARIASATADRGVFLVLTGNGKGKSSSAFGMVARALGHGFANHGGRRHTLDHGRHCRHDPQVHPF